MNVIDALRIAKRGFGAIRTWSPSAKPEFDSVEEWVQTVRNDGVCAVSGFYDPATCAELRQQIIDVTERFPSVVHSRSNGADRRVFGAEAAAEGVRAFAGEPRLLNAARTVLGRDTANAFTLAGIITYREGNLGSGEGWHRDSFFDQFKAMIYLTDVSEENGPFEYILRSHIARQKFSDHKKHGVPLISRIDDPSVRKLIAAEPDRHRVVTASMGTLLLADTTGIHRGMPLKSGERFALTNYYYPGKALRPKLFDHFSPVLGRDVQVLAAN